MNQYEIAEVFERVANLLEIRGDVVYKLLAYRKAADNLRNLSEDLETLHHESRLMEIPGVGKAIAEKIGELLDTGKLEFLDKLEQEIPPSLIELLEIPEVGPKKALMFYKEAGIHNRAELESAAKAGKLREMRGVGEKSEARILSGLEAFARRSNRMTIGYARPVAERLLNWLMAQPGVEKADFAGSLRRWRITIGDIDLIAATRAPEELMNAFASHPEVKTVIGHGDAKTSVELHSGIKVQLWALAPERYGSLLQFVTGSKEHNVELRELALKKGLSLSEKGMLAKDGSERIFANEADLYKSIGLPLIVPELREGRGEIQAALKGKLPVLIEQADLMAELHTHSTWSDGALSILEMARAAIQRGYRVLAITDHSGGLGIAGGLSADRLVEQRAEIDAVQKELGDVILLLQGSEVEIKTDGSLDFTDEVLEQLDIVIASLHMGLRQPRAEITARLINAIRNPHVDIIGHPSGRLLPSREAADLDWDQVLNAARESGIALEINANPSRLDLDEMYAYRAGQMGIPISINTDAHSPGEYDLSRFGVAVARRAWLTAPHVINTWEPERLVSWLKARGN